MSHYSWDKSTKRINIIIKEPNPGVVYTPEVVDMKIDVYNAFLVTILRKLQENDLSIIIRAAESIGFSPESTPTPESVFSCRLRL